jgi:hypothetical protein
VVVTDKSTLDQHPHTFAIHPGKRDENVVLDGYVFHGGLVQLQVHSAEEGRHGEEDLCFGEAGRWS